ncbi:MAG: lipase secretion chaperone [Pseudomonadota bacterium]
MRFEIGCAWVAAAAGAALVYSAWPSHGRHVASAASHSDNYFSFVKPTGFTAQPATPLAPAAARAIGPADDVPMPMQLAALERTVHDMRRQGAGENEIYRLRAATVSADTAARLAEMEQAEAAWRKRVEAYRLEQESVTHAPDAQGATSAANSPSGQFTPEEQSRLAAYAKPATPQLRQE